MWFDQSDDVSEPSPRSMSRPPFPKYTATSHVQGYPSLSDPPFFPLLLDTPGWESGSEQSASPAYISVAPPEVSVALDKVVGYYFHHFNHILTYVGELISGRSLQSCGGIFLTTSAKSVEIVFSLIMSELLMQFLVGGCSPL